MYLHFLFPLSLSLIPAALCDTWNVYSYPSNQGHKQGVSQVFVGQDAARERVVVSVKEGFEFDVGDIASIEFESQIDDVQEYLRRLENWYQVRDVPVKNVGAISDIWREFIEPAAGALPFLARLEVKDSSDLQRIRVLLQAPPPHLSLTLLLPSSLSVRQPKAQPPQSPLPLPPPPSAPIFSTLTCYTSASACENSTSSCSSRGTCIGVTRAGKTCFVCECGTRPVREGGTNISWAGARCEKIDVSVPFALLLSTVLLLILIIGGSISLLYSLGGIELPGVLMSNGNGLGKRD
ncbi:hypothetical protein BU17DRAFT_92126 [Hysterangium stoloniferum]|nr:hypothetical protein BU17DRAFT_92126 [Hysterangium stoloniferum]